MAAIITRRVKAFRKAYKAAPTSNGPEVKFYNAKPKERVDVLEEVAKADGAIITYICIDKRNPRAPPERGNELYKNVLRNLMEDSMRVCPTKDIRIYVDGSRFIENNHLKQMAMDISVDVGRNVKDCKKVSNDRCTRIADYVVGAIRMKYENGNSELFEIIKEKYP